MQEFGVGVLTLPAEKVLTWRRILIAEHENSTQGGGRPSKEDALARLVQEHKRKALRR